MTQIALVAGLGDVAVVGEPVEERGRHLGVAGDGGPFAETDERLPAIVAAIKGADPDITLQAICNRLEAMREHTPRGTSWQPSSVKILPECAEKPGRLERTE